MYVKKSTLKKIGSIFLKVTVFVSGTVMVSTGFQMMKQSLESVLSDDLNIKIKEDN